MSLKDSNYILEEYDKLVALLRIEKYGRDGLFTLMLYTADFKDNPYKYCCLDQINPEYLQNSNLQIYKLIHQQWQKIYLNCGKQQT